MGQVTHYVVNPPVHVSQDDTQQGPGLVELKWYPVEQLPVQLEAEPPHVTHPGPQSILIYKTNCLT